MIDSTAAELQEYLKQLQAERALAALEGLDANQTYLSDLEYDMRAAHVAYVGAAVTDIASLRGELSHPQVG